nr:hypothetical protein [Chloroflexota bacterium]
MAKRRLAAFGAAALLAVGFGAAFLVSASAAEEHDAFCASCHTAPEQTYVDRARQATGGSQPYPDLASAHYGLSAVGGGFRCIACHRGDSTTPNRLATLTLGARDAFIFVTGRADPAIEKARANAPELLNAACVQCHARALLVAGFEDHFHNKLPAAYALWKAGGELTLPASDSSASTSPANSGTLTLYSTSVVCTDCHRAHVHVDGAELQQYLDIRATVYPACVTCHREAGHGPLELTAP